jgi:hypothetical protein
LEKVALSFHEKGGFAGLTTKYAQAGHAHVKNMPEE